MQCQKNIWCVAWRGKDGFSLVGLKATEMQTQIQYLILLGGGLFGVEKRLNILFLSHGLSNVFNESGTERTLYLVLP